MGVVGPENKGKSFKTVKIYLSKEEYSDVERLAKESGFSSVGLFIKNHLLRNYNIIREERINKAKQYLDLMLRYHFTDEELEEARRRILRGVE